MECKIWAEVSWLTLTGKDPINKTRPFYLTSKYCGLKIIG